jgi:hypothetical protein
MTSATYVALATPPRTDAGDDHYRDGREVIDVLVADDGPHNTGLVTAQGVPIYRVTQRGLVGFCRD